MQNLTDLARGMIGDTDTVDRVFTDAQIEALLTRYSHRVTYAPLFGNVMLYGSTWERREFVAVTGFWADGVTLYDTNYTAIVPSTSDLIAGRWTFDANQNSVLLTGVTCDVYATCSDLLTLWAGRSEYSHSQRGRALMDAAQEMRRRTRVVVVEQ